MNLELIIQSEVSQKERKKKKQILYANTYIWNLERSYCRASVEMQTQRTDLWTQSGKKEWDKLREQH